MHDRRERQGPATGGWRWSRPIAAAVVILVAALLPLAAAGASTEVDGTQAARARAYVRSYGYLRFFYPGDEAAITDWDRFASYGAGRILSDPDVELAGALEGLFTPAHAEHLGARRMRQGSQCRWPRWSPPQ